MIEPLAPEEFCRKWVVFISGIEEGSYGYRQECCKLLAHLTGYKEVSVNNWLVSSSRVPTLIQRYLRLVNIFFQIGQILSNSPVEANKAAKSLSPTEFCEKWVTYLKNIPPGTYGYRQECCKLLAHLTDYKETSVSNWLLPQGKVPLIVQRYLYLIDALCEVHKRD